MSGLRIVEPKAPSGIERLVADYLASCRAAGLSPATIRNSYGYPLRDVFLPWCAREGITEARSLSSRQLDQLSAELMDKGGKRGQLSRHTVWTYMKAVNRFLAWAKAEGEGVEARAQLPKLPKKLIEVLERDEIQLLEESAATERDALIVRILADTGLRVGELVGLRLPDIAERDRNYFLKVQGKGQRDRLVPLSPSLHRRLRRYADRVRPREAISDRVFIAHRRRPGGEYEPLTTSGVNQMLHTLGEKAGFAKRVHPHLFRHSAATHMLRRGMDSLLVAQILGHSSLAMIQKVYAHLTPTDAHEALMRVLRGERQ